MVCQAYGRRVRGSDKILVRAEGGSLKTAGDGRQVTGDKEDDGQSRIEWE